MKIAFLTSVHPLSDIRVFKEAETLERAGYDVSLIVQHSSEENLEGVRIIPLPKPKNRFERMTRTVWRVYQKALKLNADIYHFHDPELILIALLLKRQGKHVIYDVHEDVPRQNMYRPYIPIAFRRPLSVMIEALEDFSAKRFDGVITATPFINKRYFRLGANAVNVNNYPLLSELYSEDKQWKKKENAVCYVGVIDKIRGVFEMVEAIGKTGYRLLLGGNLDSVLKESLAEMPGWRQVEALGFINRQTAKSTLSRSMAGLVIFHPEPNHINAQPNKLFEYMSAGIPVIASNFPLWMEIVEGTSCGICIDPLKPENLADAIRWIIEHPGKARQMGENGRKTIEERYNWRMEEKKLLHLYREISTRKF